MATKQNETEDKGPRSLALGAEDKALEERVARLEAENENLRRQLAASSAAHRADVGDLARTAVEGLPEYAMQTVQFRRDFSFAGIDSPNPRIRLHAHFFARAGEIAHVPTVLVERLERDHPDVFITDKNEFRDQTVISFERGPNGQPKRVTSTVPVAELRKRAQVLGTIVSR